MEIAPLQLLPSLLSFRGQFENHGQDSYLPHPLVRFVRCRTVPKVDSIELVVRTRVG